eukprot:s274_g33.t1
MAGPPLQDMAEVAKAVQRYLQRAGVALAEALKQVAEKVPDGETMTKSLRSVNETKLACASLPRSASGLEHYAERVREDWRSQGYSDESLSFPMYVVSLKLLMTMTVVECHEELLRKGQLQRYRPGMGRTLFVSHQWAGRDHPDPEFAQFRDASLQGPCGSAEWVLQSALQHLADGSVKPSTTMGMEIRCGRVHCPSMENLDFEHTFVWYDYFSCPQKDRLSTWDWDTEDREAHLQLAIDMIPNYIGFCDDFLVLCPPLIHEDESVMNQYSWSCRGWCRMEQILRELSTANSQVVVIVGDRQMLGIVQQAK